MTCPVCGFQNLASAATCAACGTSLTVEPAPAARPGDAVCATHKDLPALAPCSRCGTFYCGSCLERQADGQLQCVACREHGSLLPWDRRDQLGTLRAWWQTSVALLMSPMVTLQNAKREGTVGSSLLFAVVSSVAGFFTTVTLYALLIGGALLATAMSSNDSMGGAPAAGIGAIGGVIGLIIYFGILLGAQVAMLFVLAGIEHLVLKVTGEPNLGSYETTLRAHSLALAPYVLGLIPFCGLMVMGIWSLVLRCITLTQLQRVSAGKAVVAVLAPMLVLCGCVFVGYFMIIAAVLGAAGLSR